MKIRAQRGGYDESMAAVQEIEPTWEALEAWVQANYPGIEIEQLFVADYIYDARNGWKTCLVALDNHAIAFTDGRPQPPV